MFFYPLLSTWAWAKQNTNSVLCYPPLIVARAPAGNRTREDDEFGTDQPFEDRDENRNSETQEERQYEEEEYGADNLNEELIQTRSCQNSMMKTLPLASAVEAGKVWERMLAEIAFKRRKFTYDLLHIPQETIREFFFKKKKGEEQ